jgi:hypothetical protein
MRPSTAKERARWRNLLPSMVRQFFKMSPRGDGVIGRDHWCAGCQRNIPAGDYWNLGKHPMNCESRRMLRWLREVTAPEQYILGGEK